MERPSRSVLSRAPLLPTRRLPCSVLEVLFATFSVSYLNKWGILKNIPCAVFSSRESILGAATLVASTRQCASLGSSVKYIATVFRQVATWLFYCLVFFALLTVHTGSQLWCKRGRGLVLNCHFNNQQMEWDLWNDRKNHWRVSSCPRTFLCPLTARACSVGVGRDSQNDALTGDFWLT